MNLPILVALTAMASFQHGSAGDASEAFARLRLLQGNWRGTYAWTGARTDSGQMNAKYRVTGNGSALIEDLGAGEQPSMTSAYHLDGLARAPSNGPGRIPFPARETASRR